MTLLSLPLHPIPPNWNASKVFFPLYQNSMDFNPQKPSCNWIHCPESNQNQSYKLPLSCCVCMCRTFRKSTSQSKSNFMIKSIESEGNPVKSKSKQRFCLGSGVVTLCFNFFKIKFKAQLVIAFPCQACHSFVHLKMADLDASSTGRAWCGGGPCGGERRRRRWSVRGGWIWVVKGPP